MQEASIPGFFRTIIYLIGFYYLVKFLARIFMPILMRKAVNKVQENFNKQYQQADFNQNNPHSNYEQSTQKDFKKPTKQVGDYVDFEEIE